MFDGFLVAIVLVVAYGLQCYFVISKVRWYLKRHIRYAKASRQFHTLATLQHHSCELECGVKKEPDEFKCVNS